MLFVVWANGSADYRTYVDELLFRQTVDRYRESWDHFQPPWFYLGVVALSWLPLSLTYPATFPLWLRRLRLRDARFLLPLTWAAMVIVFFSLTAGKRDVYIMPVLPWIAFASAPFLPGIVHRFWLRCSAVAVTLIVGAGLLGAGLALLVDPGAVFWLSTDRGIEEAGTGLPWLLILLGLAAMLPALGFGVRRGVHALVAGLAGLWLLWGLAAYPLLNDALSGAGVMRRVSERLAPDAEIGMVAWKEQEVFLSDRPVTEFGFLSPWPQQLSAAIAWQKRDPRNRWILILDDAMSSCVDHAKADFVGVANRGMWWLFRQDAVDAACLKGDAPDSPEPHASGQAS
jgi:4-amino-4-deoxy-L-arabinose transferase-like glycosyltransferase